MPRHPHNGPVKKEGPSPSPAFAKEIEQGVLYQLTEEWAIVFAKLLKVGCPPLRAVLYCLPTLGTTEEGRKTAKRVAWEWQHDAAVVSALDNINGGKWHELPDETRLRLAIEKNNAEASFFLWSTSLVDTDNRDGLEKIKLCREIIKKELGGSVDDDDPMNAFARFALEYAKVAVEKKAAAAKTPPEMQESSLDNILSAPLPELEM